MLIDCVAASYDSPGESVLLRRLLQLADRFVGLDADFALRERNLDILRRKFPGDRHVQLVADFGERLSAFDDDPQFEIKR